MADSIRRSWLVAAIAAALVAISATPALGAYSHSTVEGEFPAAGGCLSVQDIAIAEPEGYVYLSCRFGTYPNEADQIKRFHLDGEPAPFSANAPYISGNTITGDPGSANGKFIYNPQIAVDNSGSVNHGKIFISSSPNLDIFLPSGLYSGAIVQPIESTIPNDINGIDVGPDGSVYLSSYEPAGRISKYNPNFQELERIYTTGGGIGSQSVISLKVDTTGAIWANQSQPVKYEKDQFTTELGPKFGTPFSAIAPFLGKPSPFVPLPLTTTPGVLGRFDVDLSDNDLYLTRGDRVETYSQGSKEEPSYKDAPDFGLGDLSGAEAIAVSADHHVYVATAGAKVVRFGPGQILPDMHTFAPAIDEVGHEGAVIRGKVELAGGGPITDCRFEYGTDTTYSEGAQQCTPDAASAPPASNYGATQEVSATLSGLSSGTTYHYRLAAENANGINYGIDRVVVPAYVLKVQTLPATEVDDGGAQLNASFDPDNLKTEYHFEYGPSTAYGLETDPVEGVEGTGVRNVSSSVTDLPVGRTFHYRVVATNENGTTVGPDLSFRTASAPDISGVRASEVSGQSAVLNATINPSGFDTTYRFEYGTTPGYGNQVPITAADIGDGEEPVAVSQAISGLQIGLTYHFRVVAINQWGESESPDTTFDFAPPSCPNDHIRQEAGSSYLPDCRAYELVSPGAAGAAILMPGRIIANSGSNEPAYGGLAAFVTNRGFASSPSRFTFYSAVSAINGLNAPISTLDMYMATRTNTGWVTSVPGLQGLDAFQTSRKECSESMSLCIDHQDTNGGSLRQEFAPYLYTAAGKEVGRLPTNVHTIEGGTEFFGNQRMSDDFSHFVFSSAEYSFFSPIHPGIAFTPDGLTSGLGSAYDNDLGDRTVTKISVLQNGEDLPLVVPKSPEEEGIDFPGVSSDGSHILMSTPGATPGSNRLFMRVDDITTYDISHGADVKPIGMTRKGDKVFFTTDAQLTTDDTDESVDLYMWEEDGEKLTRISQGNGQGDGKTCNASWGVSGCGVAPLTPLYAHPDHNRSSSPGMDDLFAETSGDVYFYSPEILDPAHPGIRGQRNLYVFHQGAVQLVATLDPGTEVTRMQIAPDGDHAALVTNSKLSQYENKGFNEVYTYDVDGDKLHCASCNPSGEPPTADVQASEAGRFMSNDGRTFFSTPDSLVPRDRNGRIIDTYEYVEGRPQLISSGLGSRDYTGGSDVLSLSFTPEHIGLENVSRDGTDVYFSTFETLVGRDFNGEFVKFYDARTGGGFAERLELAPCAAADECHGTDTSEPAYPVINSAGALPGGNAVGAGKAANKHKKKKAQKKKGKQKQKKQHRAGHRGGGGR